MARRDTGEGRVPLKLIGFPAQARMPRQASGRGLAQQAARRPRSRTASHRRIKAARLEQVGGEPAQAPIARSAGQLVQCSHGGGVVARGASGGVHGVARRQQAHDDARGDVAGGACGSGLTPAAALGATDVERPHLPPPTTSPTSHTHGDGGSRPLGGVQRLAQEHAVGG